MEIILNIEGEKHKGKDRKLYHIIFSDNKGQIKATCDCASKNMICKHVLEILTLKNMVIPDDKEEFLETGKCRLYPADNGGLTIQELQKKIDDIWLMVNKNQETSKCMEDYFNAKAAYDEAKKSLTDTKKALTKLIYEKNKKR